MPISGAAISRFEKTETGLNANSLGAVTTAIELDEDEHLGIFILDNSGTHATHVITIQASPDNTNWFDTSYTLTGTGFLNNTTIITRYIRAKVTTAEGAASVINVCVVGKQ